MAKHQYHHGELREALLDQAEKWLNSEPNRSLSIRKLAAEIGVSPTAPHAHFRTKADLLAALATRGFEMLHARTLQASNVSETPGALIENLAHAYLTFSVEKPGLYKLKFTTGVELQDYPELEKASLTSFAVLRTAIADLYPDADTAEQNARALAAWGVVHGLSSLRSEHRIHENVIDDQTPANFAKIASATILGLRST